MLAYQPGGLSERSAILTALESPPECNSVPSATSQLRKWIRWKRRATEVGVAIPDASILMRGLGRIMKTVVQTFPELSFRLSLVRNGLLVDTVPTHETVSQYSEHLLAELEQMGQQAKRREAPQDAPPKLRKVEENSKLEEPTKNFGKPNEETDGKKKTCRFFLTDAGCKRGKSCQFLHNLDGQRRCWTCGSKAHLAPACPRAEETKPRAAKIGTKNVERDAKATSSTSTSEKPEEPPESTDQTGGGEDTMKVLIDEANKMLKSLHQSDPKERTISPKVNEDKMMQLQRQLDELKKASLRPFRLSRMGCSRINGLLDSGATHPLRARRKGERVSHLPKVQVNLAGDHMHLSPTGVIIGEQNSEPIVPMGILATALKCRINWHGEDLEIVHPTLGPLEVRVQDGCPMVSYDLAMKLIEEIENLANVALRSFDVTISTERQWIQRIVHEHPVFAGLPNNIQEALVETPSMDLKSLANRRLRKLWARQGVLVHAFSGEDAGYTLKRSFHEVGGDKRLMFELDLLHGKPERDLSPTGAAYPALLRMALDGIAKAWIGGPQCRTRSMLRHIPLDGINMPRPLRAWNGEEYGIKDPSHAERDQVFQDDVLMFRFLLLYVISEEVRQANREAVPTSLLLEQPADLAHMPEVVTIWRSSPWRDLEKIYNLGTQTFNQSEFAAPATKPTTVGGNIRLEIPMPGRRGVPREVEGKTKNEICEESKALSRWPPLMMRAIATSLQVGTMKGTVKFRALSWREHVAAGHTPFRKDCLVCQQASAKDQHHRRSKLPPRAGVLSLDLSGPFHVAPDLHRKTAKYLLVGAFTWLAPNQGGDDFEDLEIPEVPAEAPELDDPEEAPLPELRDEDDVWGEVQEEREREAERKKQERQVQKANEDQPEKGGEGEEEGEVEERKTPKIVVTRLCLPIQSKRQHDVLRGIIDLYLRLRSDGYQVTQIHTDRGGEFTQEALDRWCASRSILHTTTAGDQPQSNGRAEVSVQWVKAEIRRILHAAGATFSRWPLAARNLNERLRLKQIGKPAVVPNFLEPVLIRKDFGELWSCSQLKRKPCTFLLHGSIMDIGSNVKMEALP